MLGIPASANVKFYKGEGCPECYHTGYRGRRGVFEILTINEKMRRLISEGAGYDDLLAAAMEAGFVPMRDNCRELVLAGETTAAEAARTIKSTVD